MKTKKQFIRIGLISLILIIVTGMLNISYGAGLVDTLKKIGTFGVETIVGVLTLGLQQFVLIIFAALQGITTAITGLSGDGFAGTIGAVVFNKCGMTSANFFPEVWIGEDIEFGIASLNIIKNIRTYYNIMRNLSIAISLGVLLYIGIRMAISTVASEEAKYKKMLKDWAISLVLVFVLHYIMILTFFVNNALVNALSKIDIPDTVDMVKLAATAAIPGYGWADLIVYGALVVGTTAFVIMYVKRTIVLGFLIVIAPLITITYSIDKIGDGKSQALNTWLKEFIFTVIIQPFHCIIYIVFYTSAMGALKGGLAELDMGNVIFAIASIFFMLKAEGIVKKIFGIQPSSIGDAIGTGAMVLSMATSMFKGNKGKKVSHENGKMPTMSNNIKTDSVANAQQSGQPVAQQASQQGTQQANQQANQQGSQQGNQQGNQQQAQQPPVPINNAIENSRSIGKFGKKLNDYVGRHGGKDAILGRTISRAATAAGFIAGATVGDFKTAASVGTATGGIAQTQYDNYEYKKYEKKLENNQQVFAGAYKDFAEAYKETHTGADEQEIRNAARHIYDGGGTDLTEEYERDFYAQMEQLSDSAEVMGYKDGFDYVNYSMQLYDNEALDPTNDYVRKDYEISYDSLAKNNSRVSEYNVRDAKTFYGNDYNTVDSKISEIQSDSNFAGDKDKAISAYKELKETMEKNYGTEKQKRAIQRRMDELNRATF